MALALNCEATAPVQLSGSNGQAILSQIAVPLKTNNTNNTSTNTNLWNWGSIPAGYWLNKSGMLTPFGYSNDGIWAPSI